VHAGLNASRAAAETNRSAFCPTISKFANVISRRQIVRGKLMLKQMQKQTNSIWSLRGCGCYWRAVTSPVKLISRTLTTAIEVDLN
jgi:hypothetical protein